MMARKAARKVTANLLQVAGLIFATALCVKAAGLDTQRIGGYDAAALLGHGSGVIVGIVDSGIDVNHPALTGTVTGGQPRLVAEANFVTSEPANTGDDVYGHGTAVAGQILSRDATYGGVATDARYVDARVLDSTNSFSTDAWVVNGTGYAISRGANLINLSLGYFNSNTSGNSRLSDMADYITYGLRVPITVSAGNAGTQRQSLAARPWRRLQRVQRWFHVQGLGLEPGCREQFLRPDVGRPQQAGYFRSRRPDCHGAGAHNRI